MTGAGGKRAEFTMETEYGRVFGGLMKRISKVFAVVLLMLTLGYATALAQTATAGTDVSAAGKHKHHQQLSVCPECQGAAEKVSAVEAELKAVKVKIESVREAIQARHNKAGLPQGQVTDERKPDAHKKKNLTPAEKKAKLEKLEKKNPALYKLVVQFEQLETEKKELAAELKECIKKHKK